MDQEIVLDVLGDICLSWFEADTNKMQDVSKKINECLGKSDFRIANLEAPIVQNKDAYPIHKDGPNLNIDEKYIDFIAELNIDAYTLANNHIGDFGPEAIKETINVLEKLQKEYVGSSIKVEEIYKPLRKTFRETNISIVAVCENEFGVGRNSEIGAAGYNLQKLRHLLEEEKEWADYRIVIYHGGNEHYPFPSPEQRDRFRMLVDEGADAIIGMHSHCPVGYEIYNGAPIIYSVGNFFFPRKSQSPYETWNVGYVSRLHIGDGAVKFEKIPYKFDTEGKQFELIDSRSFEEYIEKISTPIQDDRRLREFFRGWAALMGKYRFKALIKGIQDIDNIDSFCIVKNLFSCEAHRELMKTYLDLKYDDLLTEYETEMCEIRKNINISKFILTDIVKTEEQKDSMLSLRTIVCWGIGEKAEQVYRKYEPEGYQIVFADADKLKQGLSYLGKLIIAPE